jgi:hypothetical protein
MSYSPEDSAWDDAYDRMSEELYPGHKAQAIVEFSYDRLRSFYIKNPDLLVPAARNFKLAKSLLATEQPAAVVVFAASATELFLKAALLRPVVYGLVHSDAVAELVMKAALSQPGFMRYEKLLVGVFKEVARVDISSLARAGANEPLLREASRLQELRNDIIHEGADATQADGQAGFEVASAVFEKILGSVLWELGFSIQKGGRLVDEEQSSV